MAVVVAAAVGAGCVTVSMHDTRPVEILVTSTATQSPVPSATVKIEYSVWNSYGVLYKLRVPEPAEGATDSTGRVTLPLATFSERIWVGVTGARPFEIDASAVSEGSTKVAYDGTGSVPMYNVRFTPKR